MAPAGHQSKPILFFQHTSISPTITDKGHSGSRKKSILPSFQHVSIASTTASSTSSRHADEDTTVEHITVAPNKTDPNPWPDVAAPEPTAARSHSHPSAAAGAEDDAVHMQHASRNPFIFRTMLSNPLHILTHNHNDPSSHQSQPQMPLSDLTGTATSSHTRHPAPGSDTKSLFGSSRADSRDGGEPWAAVGSSGSSMQPGDRGSKGAAAKVHTRVWSEDEERAAARTAAAEGLEEIGVAVGGGGGSGGGVRVETRIARSERRM